MVSLSYCCFCVCFFLISNFMKSSVVYEASLCTFVIKISDTDLTYSLRQKQLGHFNQTLFFPFSCSPRPSQSCLSRFGHQILYTNIEETRRPQSVPTILTETVVYMRFDVSSSLQNFKKPLVDIFSPQIEGKNVPKNIQL